jgi:uncharacterized OsmC-like protein
MMNKAGLPPLVNQTEMRWQPAELQLKIVKIKREIRLVGDLTEMQRGQLVQDACHCPVHNSLAASVKIETSLVDGL